MEIKIIFKDGLIKNIKAKRLEVKKYRSVNNYIFNILNIPVLSVRRIFTSNYLTYDNQFEAWKGERNRIEAINEEGYEDLTGYGNRTKGRKNRFYIGKSTGWIPVYLEILKSNSIGGQPLMHEHRTFRIVY